MLKKLSAIYKKMSRRERFILYAATCVIAFFAVDRLVVAPFYGKITLLDENIQQQEDAIKKSLHVLVQKERIMAESKQFMAFSVEAKNPEEEMVGLLKELEAMAMQASVTLLNLKPATAAQTGEIKKYAASFECEAQMEQIVNFFYAIESSNKLYQIEKYNIQPKNKESSLARVVMTVSKTVLAA